MRVKLITLRFAPGLGGFDDRPLADFVRDKEVLAVREHFFTVHDLPHLACLVTYRESARPPATVRADNEPRSRRRRADPTADLDDTERVLFGTLREWRNARARKDGVPAYVILTNRELVNVVRTRPQTPNALGTLDGIGPGKVERYGAEILAQLNGSSDQPEEVA